MNATKPAIKRPTVRSPYAVAEPAEAPPISWSVAPGGVPMTLEVYVSIRVDNCDQAARFSEHLSQALASLPV